MALYQNQQMLLTFLLKSLIHTWKILVEIYHVSMVRINLTTELYTTKLENPYLTVINIKINGILQLKHPLKYIYEKSTVHRKNPHPNFLGMIKVSVFINSENLDVTSITRHQKLINYMT